MRDFSYLNIKDKDQLLIKLLSKKEYKTLKLMLNGLKNKEIAESLKISIKTVKYHFTSIYRILEVTGWREIYKWYHGKAAPGYMKKNPKNIKYLPVTEESFREEAKKHKIFSKMPTRFRDWVKVNNKYDLVYELFPTYKRYFLSWYEGYKFRLETDQPYKII